MPRADSNRRKWVVFLLCGCVWGVACLWAVLRGWSISTAITVMVISGVLPTVFWLEDSLRRRSGTSAGAYANLTLCSINGTIAVEGWNSRRWLWGVAFTVLSIAFALWWFENSKDGPQ